MGWTLSKSVWFYRFIMRKGKGTENNGHAYHFIIGSLPLSLKRRVENMPCDEWYNCTKSKKYGRKHVHHQDYVVFPFPLLSGNLIKSQKKIVNPWMFLPPAPVGSRRSRSRLHSLHAPASPSWCAGCARASRYRRWSARSSGLAGRSRSDSGTTAAHRTAWRTEDNRRLSGSPGHIGIVPN